MAGNCFQFSWPEWHTTLARNEEVNVIPLQTILHNFVIK